jgi:protein TonB
MHGIFRSEQAEDTVLWESSFESARPKPQLEVVRIERSVYGARRTNWPLISFILAAHATLLTGLIMFDVIPVSKPKSQPLVVTLLKLPVEPPPQVPVEIAPAEHVQPHFTSPEQIVRAPAPGMPVAVQIAPPQPPVIAPPAPTGPVKVSDLGSRMIAMTPPRYPMESRRRKEQGTVVLSLLVGIDGAVSQINLTHSSGFDRLDKAALEAVRKWRWSPTIRNGDPVAVRGTVDIPFILKA